MQDDLDLTVRRRRKTEQANITKVESRREVEDIQWLMSEKNGRRLMFGLLETAGVFLGSFTGDAETFYREGKRAVGLRYLAMLNSNCPDEYVLMLREHQEDVDRSRNARR